MRDKPERERVESRGEFSVYVKNVPLSLDKFGLAGIFQKVGKVSDVYIPLKHGTTFRRGFAFVRFWRIEDALRSIRMLNGRRIRGTQVQVSMAKPKKKGHQASRDRIQSAVKRLTFRQEWRRKSNEGKKEKGSYGKDSQVIPAQVIGQPNEEFEVWLERTLVCTSEVPRDLATLESALMEGIGINFRLSALSCFKFLLVFQTVESMQEVLKNQQDLQQWFIEVKR